MSFTVQALLLAVCAICSAYAYYIPGTYPKEFVSGDNMHGASLCGLSRTDGFSLCGVLPRFLVQLDAHANILLLSLQERSDNVTRIDKGLHVCAWQKCRNS